MDFLPGLCRESVEMCDKMHLAIGCQGMSISRNHYTMISQKLQEKR